jgi:formylglycine-generating enzyme required for sulfatase activity
VLNAAGNWSPAAHVDKGSEEQHEVEITKPFHMGIHAVTVGEFRQFVEDAKYKTESEKDGQGPPSFSNCSSAGTFASNATSTT